MFVNNNLYNEVYLMLKLNTLSRLNFPKFSKKYLVDVFIDSILYDFWNVFKTCSFDIESPVNGSGKGPISKIFFIRLSFWNWVY